LQRSGSDGFVPSHDCLDIVGDASLYTGCKGEGVMAFSTKRCIPTEYSPIGWRHHFEEERRSNRPINDCKCNKRVL